MSPARLVSTLSAAIDCAWHGEPCRLECADAETAKECRRLLRDRFGRRQAEELVEVVARNEQSGELREREER